MDEFGDRNALLDIMPKLFDSYSKKQTEKEAGQTGLFDLVNGIDENNNEKTVESITPLPDVAPALESEKLKWEKELIGVFVSSNPLNSVRGYFKRLNLVTIEELLNSESNDNYQRKKYRVGCMIESTKQITTKNGEQMMFVKLTDFVNTIDGIIFPKTFKELKEDIKKDIPVSIKGTINMRNDEKSFIVDFIKNIDIDKASKYEYTDVVLDNEDTLENNKSKTDEIDCVNIFIPKSTTKKEMNSIKKTLKDNPGDVAVNILVQNGDDGPRVLKLSQGVANNNEIRNLCNQYRY